MDPALCKQLSRYCFHWRTKRRPLFPTFLDKVPGIGFHDQGSWSTWTLSYCEFDEILCLEKEHYHRIPVHANYGSRRWILKAFKTHCEIKATKSIDICSHCSDAFHVVWTTSINALLSCTCGAHAGGTINLPSYRRLYVALIQNRQFCSGDQVRERFFPSGRWNELNWWNAISNTYSAQVTVHNPLRVNIGNPFSYFLHLGYIIDYT